VGTENVRLLRTIICPTQLGNHMFQNVYYLPVEKTSFKIYALNYGKLTVNLQRLRIVLYLLK